MHASLSRLRAPLQPSEDQVLKACQITFESTGIMPPSSATNDRRQR